ncbi:hypothetical protein ZIOFF_040564 [Zingiber officinale]|uniref:Uncharacterized protein n=1 Tax=Zingiber officinale TaxID=94328 RepID=A0A8J5G9A5_ZINOF|nr:hypothetical protein ZIOFF_040564 [Zingiber officinale]
MFGLSKMDGTKALSGLGGPNELCKLGGGRGDSEIVTELVERSPGHDFRGSSTTILPRGLSTGWTEGAGRRMTEGKNILGNTMRFGNVKNKIHGSNPYLYANARSMVLAPNAGEAFMEQS